MNKLLPVQVTKNDFNDDAKNDPRRKKTDPQDAQILTLKNLKVPFRILLHFYRLTMIKNMDECVT